MQKLILTKIKNGAEVFIFIAVAKVNIYNLTVKSYQLYQPQKTLINHIILY